MIASRRGRPVTRQMSAVLLVTSLAGCSLIQSSPKLDEPVGLLAVMPIERKEMGQGVAGESPRIAPGATRVVTAEIYEVLASAPTWRYVPDLSVTQALGKADLSGDLTERARWLGKQVGAESVLFGTVSRYVERIGAEYGVKQPAAVAIELQLLSVKSGTILWSGAFDQEQQPLSSNLFNWWQFWSGGPKWFSAQEFARLAVQRLLGDLETRLE
jgi:hypothetical protein